MLLADEHLAEEDSVHVLHFDEIRDNDQHRAGDTKYGGKRHLCCGDRRWRNALIKVLLVVVFTPLLCAGIGASADRIIYGSSPSDNFNFHTRYVAYASLVIAPLVLVRFAVSDFSKRENRKRNENIVDFCMYILLTISIGVALPRTMLAGQDAFHAVDHARKIFSVHGMFDSIRGEDDVYSWLENMMSNMYDDSFLADKTSRSLDKQGRAILLGNVRVRQNRVKSINCSEIVQKLGAVTWKECYPSFSPTHEDKTSYSPMNFTYFNTPYKSFDGRLCYPNDLLVSTDGTGDFPLAGFWTMFPADITRNDSVNQIRDMQSAGWIDKRTRLVGVDAAVMFPDFTPHSIWVSIQLNIVVTSSGKFLPQAPLAVPNYLPVTERPPTTLAMDSEEPAQDLPGFELISAVVNAKGKELRREAARQNLQEVYLADTCAVVLGGIFLIPFYLGIFSTFLYTLQVHVFNAAQDWRVYLRRYFNYSEILWMAMVVLSWVYWCLAAYVQACTVSVLVQDPFPSATDNLSNIRTGLAARLELQNLANNWASARNLLGFSLFLHLFNFLKFLVKFKSLGALIRTLNTALPELLSFSVSFSVIFIAFVSMFFVLFSVEASEYMSFERSILSLWLGMLGELEVTSALWRNKSWALPMIILFTFISVFVLLTLIVAIVSNAHEKVQVVNDADEAVLREQRLMNTIVSAIMKNIRPTVKPQRITPLPLVSPLVNDAVQKEQDLVKLQSFRQSLKRWVLHGRQRAAQKSADHNALLGANQAVDGVPKTDGQSEGLKQRSSAV